MFMEVIDVQFDAVARGHCVVCGILRSSRRDVNIGGAWVQKAEEVIATRDLLGIESRRGRNAGIEVGELVQWVVVGM